MGVCVACKHAISVIVCNETKSILKLFCNANYSLRQDCISKSGTYYYCKQLQNESNDLIILQSPNNLRQQIANYPINHIDSDVSIIYDPNMIVSQEPFTENPQRRYNWQYTKVWYTSLKNNNIKLYLLWNKLDLKSP